MTEKKIAGAESAREKMGELQEHESLFRNIVERSFQGVFEMDRRGTFTYVSPSVAQIAGFDVSEVVGEPFRKFIHPPDLPLLLKTIVTLLRGTEVQGLQYRIRKKDGSVDYVEINAFPVYEKGEVQKIQGVIRSITDKSIDKGGIHRFSSLMDTAMDSANVWIDVLGAEGNVMTWNRAAEEISGYRREEVIGHNWIWKWLYPDPEYRTSIMSTASAIIKQEKEVTNFETVIHTKDGQRKIISWHSCALTDQNGHSTGSIAIGRDVTAQKQAETALRNQIGTTKAILNATPDMTVLADQEGRVIDCNHSFLQSLGAKKEEVVGHTLEKILPADILKGRLEKVQEVVKTKNPLQWEDSRDGRWFENRVYPIIDEDGKVTQMAAFIRDITEEKNMREQLLEQKKMAALGKIAAVVAHELNTPLANIAVTADYLAAQFPAQAREELQEIKRHVFIASHIIKRVLGFSRMQEVIKQPANIKNIVEQAVASVRNAYDLDGITVTLSVRSCPLRADAHRLHEAFTNVIANAVLAREPTQDNHRVDITSSTTEEQVTVTVVDNGVGMDPTTRERACEAFFTTRPPGEGTGLGLFVATFIIEQHGGKLTIDSTAGSGTVVRITLPRGRA